MPPISGKGPGCGLEAGEVVVDLAGDVALQAAHDVELGQALVVRRWTEALVGGWQRIRTSAIRHSAWLAWRSPPRCSRWRWVRPEDAGMGAVPHRCAKEASERRRWVVAGGDSSCPAVSIPTPGRATRVGAAALTVPAAGCRVGGARPATAASGGPGSAGGLVAAVGLVSGPGRIAAQAVTSAWS